MVRGPPTSFPPHLVLLFPDTEAWMQELAGRAYSWRHALFTTDVYIQGARYQNNPLRRLLTPTRGMVVEIAHPKDPAKTTISGQRTQLNQANWSRRLDISLVGKNGDSDESCGKRGLQRVTLCLFHSASCTTRRLATPLSTK